MRNLSRASHACLQVGATVYGEQLYGPAEWVCIPGPTSANASWVDFRAGTTVQSTDTITAAVHTEVCRTADTCSAVSKAVGRSNAEMGWVHHAAQSSLL